MRPDLLCRSGLCIAIVNSRHIPQPFLHPPLATLRENFIQVAFKEFAGVLEVLFGVGFGLGNGVKGFVEYAHDPPLFGEGRER